MRHYAFILRDAMQKYIIFMRLVTDIQYIAPTTAANLAIIRIFLQTILHIAVFTHSDNSPVLVLSGEIAEQQNPSKTRRTSAAKQRRRRRRKGRVNSNSLEVGRTLMTDTVAVLLRI